jgi:hypothetical protein
LVYRMIYLIHQLAYDNTTQIGQEVQGMNRNFHTSVTIGKIEVYIELSKWAEPTGPAP